MDEAIQMAVGVLGILGLVWLAVKSALFHWFAELLAVTFIMLSGVSLGLGGALFVHIPRENYGMATVCVLIGALLSWPCVMICWWRFTQLLAQAKEKLIAPTRAT